MDWGDLKCISSYGIKISDQYIVMSFLHSSDSFYLNVRHFSSELEIISSEEFPLTRYSPANVNAFISYVETHTCKDNDGNTYIMLFTSLTERNVLCLSFDALGNQMNFKYLVKNLSSIENDGFFYDINFDKLVYIIDDYLKFNFNKNFELVSTVDLTTDNNWTSPFDTTSGWSTSFINVGNEVARFGKTFFNYSNVEIDSFSGIQGRAISFADQNGSIKGKVNFTPFPISAESEGTPRLSGGIFHKDGIFYTIFEFSSTAFPFQTGNTTYITKYDENFDIVEETSFVLDPGYRLYTVWADLTDNKSFIGSGFYYNVSPNNPNPATNGGGFVFGLTADGRPPDLSSNIPIIKAIFTVKGNPTSDKLILETDSQKANDYKVLILDINGRIIRSSTSWHQGRLEMDVSDQMSGTYFYQILEKGQTVTGGKFVKI